MKNIKLIELRAINNQTQEQAAKLFDVSTSYYAQVECGAVKAGRGFIEKFKSVYPNETTDIFFGEVS